MRSSSAPGRRGASPRSCWHAQGARVALVDKSTFPRDKACGDLVGPRGVRVLSELGIEMTGASTVGDMIVVGPTGRRVRLPAYPGRTYPGHAIAVPRHDFDNALRNAALTASAEARTGRAERPPFGDDGLEGFALSTGAELRADMVLGADGATSRVAAAANLVVPDGCCGRSPSAPTPKRTPIVHTSRSGNPPAGVRFPDTAGFPRSHRIVEPRSRHRYAVHPERRRDRDPPTSRLHHPPTRTRSHRHRHSPHPTRRLAQARSLVGTTPARGHVLLIGDAAGLVNPLQGEGIGAALGSGRAAAEATLAGPPRAPASYLTYLRTTHMRFMASTAPAHAALLGRPRTIALLARALTAPTVSAAIAGAWSLYWNDLIGGATPSPSATVAAAAAGLGTLATSRSDTAQWITQTLNPHAPDPAQTRRTYRD